MTAEAAWKAQEATLRALIADLEVRAAAATSPALRAALEAQRRGQERDLAWVCRRGRSA